MQVYCGVSGFSYREWRGKFYPAGLRPEDMLGFYARHLWTTELNNTFYRMPAAEQLEGWAGQVPADFRFSLKAPRTVTHIRRLLGVEPIVEEFLNRAGHMRARLGPILFQLPPQLKLDLARFDGFLESLERARGPRELRFAVEFRHTSWFIDAVFGRLRERNISLVVGDDDELESPPLLATASFCYARLRKTQPYDAPTLDRWAAALGKLSVDELFVYFKHEVHAPEQAVAFRARFP